MTTEAPVKRKRPQRRGPPGVQCPGCNKLAGLEDPEVESLEANVDDDSVTISVHIVRNSSCCGDEIKSADLEGTTTVGHDCPNADIIGRTVYVDGNQHEIEGGFEDDVEGELEGYTSGGGRYKKMMVGASGTLTATCKSCGENIEFNVDEGVLEIAAGDMDISV